MEQRTDKRTASQKIDDLERGMAAMFQTVDGMARDMNVLKDAIKLLGNKMDAMTKLSLGGEALTDENISRVMVANNVEELKQKVKDLVDQGILEAGTEVGPNSFVAGPELSADGSKVVNPRMQFMVSALTPEVKEKFPGAKVGDVLTLQEGKWKFQVEEVYNIVTPKAPEAPQDQADEQA